MSALRLCCDVFHFLSSPSDKLQHLILESFMNAQREFFSCQKYDVQRIKSLRDEIRAILAVLHLFPVEIKLAMDVHPYKKVLISFLSLYLDLQALVMTNETEIKKSMDELLIILKDEPLSAWQVLCVSSVTSKPRILCHLAMRILEKTKEYRYSHDQYISLVLIYRYLDDKFKNDLPNELKQSAIKVNYPNNLSLWIVHHFSGFGFKGYTDKEIHTSLFEEFLPRNLFITFVLKIVQDQVSFRSIDMKTFAIHDKRNNKKMDNDVSIKSSKVSKNKTNNSLKMVINLSKKTAHPKKERIQFNIKSDISYSKSRGVKTSRRRVSRERSYIQSQCINSKKRVSYKHDKDGFTEAKLNNTNEINGHSESYEEVLRNFEAEKCIPGSPVIILENLKYLIPVLNADWDLSQ